MRAHPLPQARAPKWEGEVGGGCRNPLNLRKILKINRICYYVHVISMGGWFPLNSSSYIVYMYFHLHGNSKNGTFYSVNILKYESF